MPDYSEMHSNDPLLEILADAMLEAAPYGGDWPVYTERQLTTRGRRAMRRSIAARFCAARPAQPTRDELRFLAGVSCPDEAQRVCVEMWADGWAVTEMARAVGMSLRQTRRLLGFGLRACRRAAPVSFRRFSRHTVYHPPSHAGTCARRCSFCAAPLAADEGCAQCSARSIPPRNGDLHHIA